VRARTVTERYWGKCLLFVLTALLPHSLWAGDDFRGDTPQGDEELLLFADIPSVYGASKYEQKVTEAPSSVSIVTADEIRKYGYRNLAELLQGVRGLYLSYDRTYQYLGVRGFSRPGDYNTRILLLIDGHRINDSVYDAALLGTEFPLDIDLIERVEIARGPGSSLYGSNAFFGIINVITRQGRAVKGLELSGEIGSHDMGKGRISYGDRFPNGLEVILSGSYYDSDGRERLYFREFDTLETNNGVFEDGDGDNFESLFATLSWYDFTFQGLYHDRKKDIPTAAWDTVFNDNRSFSEDESGYVNLEYEGQFYRDVELNAKVYYDFYHYHGDYVYDYSEDDESHIVVNRDKTRANRVGTEIKFSKKFFDSHYMSLGGDYRNNLQQDQENYDEDVYLDDKRDSEDWGVYFQDEWNALDSLTVNAGVRYDHYEISGDTVNQRLALIYSPVDRTAVKLLYGSAFRAPNVYELYYHDGGSSSKAANDLDNETMETYEFILEQYIGEHWRLTASGFYYEIKDLINLRSDTADGLLVFDNLDEAKASGVEFEIEGKWVNGWEGRLSYIYQETEDMETERILSNSPRQLAKCNLIAPLLRDRLFLGTEIQYTDQRETLSGNEVDGFFVTNATLFCRGIIPGLKFSFSVYNLFDKKYDHPGSEEHLQDVITQDGRTSRFKLTYVF
jgi:outer membrane receptor for ferrienterochelin and colicins